MSSVPLGQGIGEMWNAVQNRIEASSHGSTWHVTAGSFDAALDFARESFEDPVVLARKDRSRWWPRVTLIVTTDPALTGSAPSLESFAGPVIPAQRTRSSMVPDTTPRRGTAPLPSSLEAIFAHQEEQRLARQRALAKAMARRHGTPRADRDLAAGEASQVGRGSG